MLYVVGWCERNPEEGKAFFEQVAGDGGTSPRAILFGALEIDPPDVGAERIVRLIRGNSIEPTRAVGRVQGGRWLRDVSEAPLVNVLQLVAGGEMENSGLIPELIEFRLHGRALGAGPLADFAWRCLEAHPTLDRHMGDYYSDHLAGRLAPLNPDRGFALLERCMVDDRPGQRWKPFVSGPNHLIFWKELCRIDRHRALTTVLDVACRGGPARWTVQWWLPGLVDIATDSDFLLKYSVRGENEALIVCETITGGRHGFWPLVFGLIERHPSSQRLKSALELRVVQMGQVMMGPFSERHRQWLADVEGARQLPEATPAVRTWLDDFAGRLRLGLQEQLRREADERVNRG